MISSSATQPYSIPLGILVDRESEVDWLANRWRAVGVLLDPPQIVTASATRREGPFHAATIPLLLDGRKTMDYKVNLANGEPSVYVVMADGVRGSRAPRVDVRMVSASPFEVQPFRDAGQALVDRVPMPQPLVTLLRSLVDEWPLARLGAVG